MGYQKVKAPPQKKKKAKTPAIFPARLGVKSHQNGSDLASCQHYHHSFFFFFSFCPYLCLMCIYAFTIVPVWA